MVILPVFLSNCSPKDITGIAEAKNIYVVGAKTLNEYNQQTRSSYMQTDCKRIHWKFSKPDTGANTASPILLVALKPSLKIIFYSSEGNECFLHDHSKDHKLPTGNQKLFFNYRLEVTREANRMFEYAFEGWLIHDHWLDSQNLSSTASVIVDRNLHLT